MGEYQRQVPVNVRLGSAAAQRPGQGAQLESVQQGHSPTGRAGPPPSAGHATSARSAAPAPGTARGVPEAQGSGRRSRPPEMGHTARSSPAASEAACSPGGPTGSVCLLQRWHPTSPALSFSRACNSAEAGRFRPLKWCSCLAQGLAEDRGTGEEGQRHEKTWREGRFPGDQQILIDNHHMLGLEQE